MSTDLEQSRNCMGNKDLGAPPASQDRATDAPHEAPSGLRPDGSVSTGAGAFTPGPWHGGREGNLRVYGPDCEGEHSGLIAVVYKGRANVNLIAAAPELYEALADCVKRLRRCAENGGNAPFAVDALCAQFEAALAKARGEQ